MRRQPPIESEVATSAVVNGALREFMRGGRVERLIQPFRTGDEEARRRAAETMAGLVCSSPDRAQLTLVLLALTEAMANENEGVRDAAMRAILLVGGGVRDPSDLKMAVDTLGKRLQGPRAEARGCAIAALDLLAWFQPGAVESIVPAIIEALEDEHPDIRQGAAHTLEVMGSPTATAALRRNQAR